MENKENSLQKILIGVFLFFLLVAGVLLGLYFSTKDAKEGVSQKNKTSFLESMDKKATITKLEEIGQDLAFRLVTPTDIAYYGAMSKC